MPTRSRASSTQPDTRARGSRPAYGIYVWEPFPGCTHFEAVDRDGTVLRSMQMPTHFVTEADFEDMRRFLAQRGSKLALVR